MKRRDFLAAAAGALGAVSAGVAQAQRAGSSRLGKIGLQLYTLRDMMQKSVPRTLAAVAKAGYEEVEFAGYFNVNPTVMKQLLADHGLTAPSAHIGMDDLGMKWESVLDDANILGLTYLTVAWIDAPERTVDGYRRIANRFNAAGRRASSEGVKLAFHNHSYLFDPIKGTVPYDILLGETDPKYVAMEADIYWMEQANEDPLKWFAKYPGRFHMLHLKDMGRPPKRDMMDVGKGVIDWRAILSRSKQAGVRHFIVEHDEPKNPLSSIRSSYQYLRGLRF